MKNLTIGKGVLLNDILERTLYLIDPYFKDEPSEVTSGIRTSEEQLETIIEKVRRKGIEKLYPEFIQGITKRDPVNMNVTITNEKGESTIVYYWQRPWSKLLSIGEIVNPPIKAKVLFDYWRPGVEKTPANNKKGQEINVSPHVLKHAFDIGGGKNINKKAQIIDKALKEKKCFIQSYLKEPVNNCVHVDCMSI